jgi:hypothetical protein
MPVHIEESYVQELLKTGGVSQDGWGKNGTKNFGQLMAELQNGEASLAFTGRRLFRQLRILNLDVYYVDCETNQRFRLIEKEQVFKDGSKRIRSKSPSVGEKLCKDESADEQSISRALKEELGINWPAAKFYATDFYTTQSHSKSYPGLETRTEVFRFDVYLTPEQFRRQGYIEYQSDKTTYFVWEEI